jgi:hypothetical protein
MMPPIAIAHGVMVRVCVSILGGASRFLLTLDVALLHAQGFIAQKYLESFALAGLIMINSIPPDPGTLTPSVWCRIKPHAASTSFSVYLQQPAQ